ncbi:MAG TPA: hypothetical protein GX743_01600, partial [Actinomycetales bacterium]|nr:hypothetical protein [Actinomycetales bacterium]
MVVVEKFAPAAQKGIVILVELAVIFFVIAAYIVGGLAVAQGSANQNISSLPLTVGQIYS